MRAPLALVSTAVTAQPVRTGTCAASAALSSPIPPSKASTRKPPSTKRVVSSANASEWSSGSASKVEEKAGANRYSIGSAPTAG